MTQRLFKKIISLLKIMKTRRCLDLDLQVEHFKS